MITIYTDGACKGNGQAGDSAGGFGAYICYPDGKTHSIWGGEPATTNNRMELLGAITALQNTPADVPLQIITDSNYVKNGITEWIASWKKNNWKKADKKPVLNQDLWQQLDDLTQNRVIDWQWIKGHAGFFGNEMADDLANKGVNSSGELWEFPANTTTNPTTTSTPSDDTLDVDDINTLLASAVSSEETAPPIRKNKKHARVSPPIHIDYNEEQNPDYDGDTSDFNPHFRPIIPKPINTGHPERQLIMDTETTGFEENNGDRIVEVGMIEMVGRKFTGQKLHIYINPNKEMDKEVIKVHGISNEFLEDKPTFEQVADKILEFAKGAELIAHNAAFDMRFLDMEFTRAGLPKLSEQVTVTDSLAMARQLFRGQRNTLDALVQRLGVGKKDRTFHGALLDSEILAEVYLAMTSGQVTLDIGSGDSKGNVNIHHESLTHLAALLAGSPNDADGDATWRANHFKKSNK